MPVATRRELLEAGVHFGHQTRRWNPKMARYIFAERSGIYIIDLEKTLAGLHDTYQFLLEVGRRNGTVLLVGTKKQAQETVAEQASRVGMPYVNTRWLGGMLTNFQTIYGRLRRLRELRDMERSGAFDFLPKKEVLRLRREKEKLERNLSGIQDMERLPEAIFVIDTKKEHIAVKEARKLGIPVVAIVDTNCDPDEVDYPIPGNDDAIRACSLIARIVADAIQEGQYLAYQGMQARATEPEFEHEPAAASLASTEVDEGPRRARLSEDEAAWMGEVLEEDHLAAESTVPEAPAPGSSEQEAAPVDVADQTGPSPAAATADADSTAPIVDGEADAASPIDGDADEGGAGEGDEDTSPLPPAEGESESDAEGGSTGGEAP